MTETTRKIWAAGDGNGGYDLGEGDFTIASVRNLAESDGKKVARAYAQAFGHSARATAMLFRASPDVLDAAKAVIAELDSEGDFENWERCKANLRAAIAKSEGAA